MEYTASTGVALQSSANAVCDCSSLSADDPGAGRRSARASISLPARTRDGAGVELRGFEPLTLACHAVSASSPTTGQGPAPSPTAFSE
jgi:hypothetical protein